MPQVGRKSTGFRGGSVTKWLTVQRAGRLRVPVDTVDVCPAHLRRKTGGAGSAVAPQEFGVDREGVADHPFQGEVGFHVGATAPGQGIPGARPEGEGLGERRS